MSSQRRVVVLVAAVVVVVAGAIIAASVGGKDERDGAVTRATVTVKDGKPVGGVQKVTFLKGRQINLTVRSDTADEVHFHGYDVHQDVKAGGSVTFRLKATITGRFVVELEQSGTELAEVTVA